MERLINQMQINALILTSIESTGDEHKGVLDKKSTPQRDVEVQILIGIKGLLN
jgi:hypothetical protein